MGAQTIAITNVVNSSLTLPVRAAVYLRVGPEIGVVATKTFTGQLAVLYTMGLHLAGQLKSMDASRRSELLAALEEPDLLILALATQSKTYDKVVSNLQEVKARRARVVAIATDGDEEIGRH